MVVDWWRNFQTTHSITEYEHFMCLCGTYNRTQKKLQQTSNDIMYISLLFAYLALNKLCDFSSHNRQTHTEKQKMYTRKRA